jgi:hypothetical protein
MAVIFQNFSKYLTVLGCMNTMLLSVSPVVLELYPMVVGVADMNDFVIVVAAVVKVVKCFVFDFVENIVRRKFVSVLIDMVHCMNLSVYPYIAVVADFLDHIDKFDCSDKRHENVIPLSFVGFAAIAVVVHYDCSIHYCNSD